MQTNYTTTSLDGLLDEDPDPDLKLGKDVLKKDRLTNYFDVVDGTYTPKKVIELNLKSIYS